MVPPEPLEPREKPQLLFKDKPTKDQIDSLVDFVRGLKSLKPGALDKGFLRQAERYLPDVKFKNNLKTSEADGYSLDGDGKRLLEAKYRCAWALIKDKSDQERNVHLTKVTGPDKTLWTIQPDGTWKGKLPGGAERKADSIKILGEGNSAQVIIKEGDKTTIQRMDGSTVSETKGANGSSHVVARDKDGNSSTVFHNGRRFTVSGGKVFNAAGNEIKGASYDARSMEISFTNKKGDISVTLKEDGTTFAKKNSGASIIGFGDGSRMYLDKDDKVIGARDVDRNYITVKDGKLFVTDKKGDVVPGHKLHGKEPYSIDKNEGAFNFRDGDKTTSLYLDKRERIGHIDGAPLNVRDAAGNKFDFEYIGAPPALDRLKAVKRNGVTVYDKGSAEFSGCEIQSYKGKLNIFMKNGKEVQYDLSRGSKTTIAGDRITTEFADKHEEIRERGRLTEFTTSDKCRWGFKYLDEKHPNKITEAECGGIVHRAGPRKEIDFRDHTLTVKEKGSNGQKITTYHSDSSADILYPDRHRALLKLDKDGKAYDLKVAGKHYELEPRGGDAGFTRLAIDRREAYRIGAGGNAEEISSDGKGKIVVRLKDGGKVMIDPEKQTTTSDTASKTTIKGPRSEIEVDKTAGKAILRGKDGKIAFTAEFSPDGDGPVKIRKPGRKNSVYSREKGNQVIAENDKLTVVDKTGKPIKSFYFDGSTERKHGGVTDRKSPDGWVMHREFGAMNIDIEYLKKTNGKVDTEKGRALPENIKLNHLGISINQRIDKDGRRSYAVEKESKDGKRETYVFDTCTVDRRGTIHLGKKGGGHFTVNDTTGKIELDKREAAHRLMVREKAPLPKERGTGEWPPKDRDCSVVKFADSSWTKTYKKPIACEYMNKTIYLAAATYDSRSGAHRYAFTDSKGSVNHVEEVRGNMRRTIDRKVTGSPVDIWTTSLSRKNGEQYLGGPPRLFAADRMTVKNIDHMGNLHMTEYPARFDKSLKKFVFTPANVHHVSRPRDFRKGPVLEPPPVIPRRVV